MSRLPLAAMMMMLIGLLGCKHHQRQKQLPTSAPAPIVQVEQQKLTPPPAPHLPVKEGPAPQALMIDNGGLVQVVDAQSGELLAQAVAPPRSIMSIDDSAGIRIAGQLIVKGPLPPGRTYQIFVDNNGGADNTWRSEIIKPGRQ